MVRVINNSPSGLRSSSSFSQRPRREIHIIPAIPLHLRRRPAIQTRPRRSAEHGPSPLSMQWNPADEPAPALPIEQQEQRDDGVEVFVYPVDHDESSEYPAEDWPQEACSSEYVAQSGNAADHRDDYIKMLWIASFRPDWPELTEVIRRYAPPKYKKRRKSEISDTAELEELGLTLEECTDPDLDIEDIPEDFKTKFERTIDRLQELFKICCPDESLDWP